MSIYTTPLQFGYFLALSMAIMFWIRGYKNQRLSDFYLGNIMLLLGLEIQDYTFGFAGIEILWNELNGIYRNVALLLWPSIYLYIKSQTNTSFKLKPKVWLHYLPWALVFLLHLIIFLNGKYAVQAFQESSWALLLSWVLRGVNAIILVVYAIKTRNIYKNYQRWSLQQFSNVAMIEFKWFRNFFYALIFGFGFQTISILLDSYYNWDFNKDWWWNLGLVGVIFFIGIEGYAQFQPAQILMNSEDQNQNEVMASKTVDNGLLNKLDDLMKAEKPFTNAELSLNQLSLMLKTNSSELSFLINSSKKKNFNDYINALRIEEFINLTKLQNNQNLTLEALAYESGFNSKSTFNRAFKKVHGSSPTAYLQSIKQS